MHQSYLDRYAETQGPIQRLDARTKLLGGLFVSLALISLPAFSLSTLAIPVIFLGALSCLSRIPALFFVRRLALIVPFVLVVALFVPFLPNTSGPTWSLGSGQVRLSASGILALSNILAKALLVAWTVSLVVATTGMRALLEGLERLRTPQVFVLTTAFAYRYLFLLVDEARRMKRAADSRGFTPRSLVEAHTLGHIIGMFFLRSYERAERVYQAMAARGFEPGDLRTSEGSPLATWDWVGLGAALLFSLYLFLIGHVS